MVIKSSNRNLFVFAGLWLLTFVLYIPAAKAGWVIDAAGFLYNLKHQGFWTFINRTASSDQSFYQVLTLHYYLFYKLWGFNLWMWGLLYITVHALNAFLLFAIAKNIFRDAGLKNAVLISLAGVVLFCVSPQISEVLIGRAYYHYLQCFFFMLACIWCTQRYIYTSRPLFAAGAVVLFILASVTLEIFYLLPVFVLSLALFYRYYLGYDKKVLRGVTFYIFTPQLLLLGAYFIALIAVYKHFTPHKIELAQTSLDYLSKLPKYILHIVLLGRYFSLEVKEKLYALCQSVVVLLVFYSIIIFVFVYCINRFRQLGPAAKVMFLFFTWSVLAIAFLIPLPFPQPELLVFYDRYTYFASGFVYMLLAMLIAAYVRNKHVIIGLFCIYFDLNLNFTIMVNTYWIDSDKVNTQLIKNFPNDESKTVLLLNIPENMNGVPMIGAQPEGMFGIMREIYTGNAAKNKIYDVASYNMGADYSSAHVMVLNDSMLNVVLNNSGSWWWYAGHGAKDYETPDYKMKLGQAGTYTITLKQPAANCLLLYSAGDAWKKVDMSIRDKQQN